MEVTIEYSNYSVTYVKTEVYCGNCGEQTVWKTKLEDHYLGSTGYCLSCLTSHYNADDFYNISGDEHSAVAIIKEKLKNEGIV